MGIVGCEAIIGYYTCKSEQRILFLAYRIKT